MVPHALENLYWMGRYTERAEGTTRHLLALRRLATELPVWYADPGRGAVDVLARALTHATATYPGFVDESAVADAALDAELRALLIDETRPGSVAQAIEALTGATGAVRDQLSPDVFTVLGGIDRALDELADAPVVRGTDILDAGSQVLSGTLALAGITVENMVHDAGLAPARHRPRHRACQPADDAGEVDHGRGAAALDRAAPGHVGAHRRRERADPPPPLRGHPGRRDDARPAAARRRATRARSPSS